MTDEEFVAFMVQEAQNLFEPHELHTMATEHEITSFVADKPQKLDAKRKEDGVVACECGKTWHYVNGAVVS